ncbi:putative wiskott-Aldrich syndrome protein [Cocos nucifera]|uniref:Putative wiskott-Aldrich syndrome protein n=1 Tax=Cocos nucifera TaxID=13894 RepID=A0A8K0ILL6_COCNU|nr:putative wiskott-Aldrich syndrome protein [Cocos nucifera]
MASFGSRPPPSRYSSLPSFSATPSVVAPPPAFPPPPPLHQPPLLPLPFSKSATLPSPSPTKRIAAAAVTTTRTRDKRNKSKPDGNPRKEARSSGTTSGRSDRPKGESVSVVPQKSAQKSASPPPPAERKEKVKEGGEEEERFAMESVYSLSPPPSSLPLPTFFLIKRPKAASAASCVAEAMGCGDACGGGRVNAGATDDLRRLLRL